MSESITLYLRQGASDKVYQAAIENKGGGHIVTFAYGRRGSTMTVGAKTQTPVSYDNAKTIFDKLVREKTAKGYRPGSDGQPYQQTDKAGSATGIHCQLLNPVDESWLGRLIRDPAYWMQQKHDGRRLLLQKSGDTVTGINKLGLAVAVPSPIEKAALAFRQDFIIDGEAVGEILHAFDLLSIEGEDVQARGYCDRNLHLINLLASGQQRNIRLIQTAFMPKQKQELFDQLKADGAEGVVFKHLIASYTPGRPNSGGSQFKFKFCESASFIVGKVNAKRSVALSLFDGSELVSVGNVTIPPNCEIPRASQVVEVRYLYAFKGGSVLQPVYLGIRDDIRPGECSLDQLKYKTEEPQAA